ncbi:MAG: hypothetical protein JXB10_10595, partial [Pirellulales bacterium]|nr:hypothetical protein [Pirellulales bacterium]
FFRELALPYALTAAAIAAWRRRRRELIGWTLGLTAWAAFYAWHAWRVSALIPEDAPSHAASYFHLGGWQFTLGAFQMNYYLLILPLWCTAVFLAVGTAGLLRRGNAFTRRVAAGIGAYLLFFSFVGQDFNTYWGFLVTPLVCFGFARFFFVLRSRRLPAFSP